MRTALLFFYLLSLLYYLLSKSNKTLEAPLRWLKGIRLKNPLANPPTVCYNIHTKTLFSG